MYIENYYIDSTEYIVNCFDGTYEVYNTDTEAVEFSGTYQNCKAYLTELEEAYLEATLF